MPRQFRKNFGNRRRFPHKNTRPFGARKRFARGPAPAPRLDISKFINKATIEERVERFVPEHSFADFALDPRLKHNIAKKAYTAPTPIQDRAINHILRGEDVVGIAQTGTGKTGAFLIPLINKTLLNKKEKVLIMVPTRELALQIQEELKGFARG